MKRLPDDFNAKGVEVATLRLLEALGMDIGSGALVDTPKRVARFWREFLTPEDANYDRTFETDLDEMIILRDIRFHSMCEHHLLPFSGRAAVAYIPSGKVLGLSKLARIVRLHAGALQLQERLTSEVAATVQELAATVDVAVSMSAVHLCAVMRGVRSEDSVFTTNALRGAFHDEGAARAEFLDAVKGAKR